MDKSQCKLTNLNYFYYLCFFLVSAQIAPYNTTAFHYHTIGGSIGGRVTGVIFEIKESNKTKQKIEDNSLEKEGEEKLHFCLFFFVCTRVDTCKNKHFSFKIFLLNPSPPFEKFMDPRLSSVLSRR